ncbi:MAG TPA: hypothetical protein VFL66_04395 [Gaiellaceae bacterium]|nr:hypothetical protein [Gaiellaceae bacterium]
MADGVRVHIRARALEIVVVLDRTGLEAAAEQVSPTLVPPVEPLRVDAAEAVDAVRERPAVGLDDEVEVVSHQDEDDRPPAEAPLDLGTQSHPVAAIVVVGGDRNPTRAPRRDVEDAVLRQNRSRQTRHVVDGSRRAAAKPPARREVTLSTQLFRVTTGDSPRGKCGGQTSPSKYSS